MNKNDSLFVVSWSPRGKNIAIVTYDGALELYEPNMNLKNTLSSAINDTSLPPCVTLLWYSTDQFLRGFSEHNSSENNNDTFFYIMVTYDKV